jgi:uncharacterized protein
MLGKPEMTIREAGKRGGDAVKAKYGPQSVSKRGKKGSDAIPEERGRESKPEIDKKSGKSGGGV